MPFLSFTFFSPYGLFLSRTRAVEDCFGIKWGLNGMLILHDKIFICHEKQN